MCGCISALSSTATSLDCYDPDTNTWSAVTNLNIGRFGHSLFNLHGKLYVIGGKNEMGDVLPIEVYNHIQDRWTLLEDKLNLCKTGSCLMKKYFVE